MPARPRGTVWSCVLLFALVVAPRSVVAEGSAIPAAGRDSWVELRTASFVTLTNAGERKGREIALSFERFRGALQMLLPAGVPEPSVPTHIIVFASDDDFDPYKVGSGDRRQQLLGLFQQSPVANFVLLNGYPARGSALPVAYHEYLHSVAHAAFARLPLWLDEGLAEFYSTFALERGSLLVGKPVVPHVQLLRERSFLPLGQLFAVDHASPEYQEGERVGTFYAESWLVVHYLMLGGPERLQHMRAFLAGMREGKAPEPAFRGAFGYGFDQLEKELRGYVNAPTFPFLRLPEAELGPEPPVTRRPLSAGDALYELGAVLALRETQSETIARQHLEAALAAGVTDAWAILGWLEERSGHTEKAADLYRKVQGSASARPEALVLAARAQLSGSTPTAASALAARALLERALVTAPGYSEAQALLGKTWLWTDDDPAPGIAQLTQAFERLPGRADVAYDLAMLNLKAGKIAQAEQLVRKVVVPLGSADMAAAATTALEQVKAGARIVPAGDTAPVNTAAQRAGGETAGSRPANLEKQLRAAEEMDKKQLQIERFNAAADAANAGKRAEAREALRALRQEVTDEELLRTIDAALAKIEKALRRP